MSHFSASYHMSYRAQAPFLQPASHLTTSYSTIRCCCYHTLLEQLPCTFIYTTVLSPEYRLTHPSPVRHLTISNHTLLIVIVQYRAQAPSCQHMSHLSASYHMLYRAQAPFLQPASHLTTTILDKKSWNTWCQRSLINRLSPLPHYNVGLDSNGKQTTLHGVGGGGGVNL